MVRDILHGVFGKNDILFQCESLHNKSVMQEMSYGT